MSVTRLHDRPLPWHPPSTSGTRRSAVQGLLSGVAGGICCFAGALAAGLGLGGVSFFGTLMDRYQPLFLAFSVLMMGVWLRHIARGVAPGLGTADRLRALLRPVLVMASMWAVTLMVAMVAARAAGLG